MSTTATMTTTAPAESPVFTAAAATGGVGVLPLKADPALATTLESLYNPASRAFLHSEIDAAQKLIDRAFEMLGPPTSATDPLHDQRCKWDILRITRETLLYADRNLDRNVLPPALRESVQLSPQAFVNATHERSLALFTPARASSSSSSCEFLPRSVLITLMASSIKVNCPAVGRRMVEDWFAEHARDDDDHDPSSVERRESIFKLYCLQILPHLGEWDFAREFLQGVAGLSNEKRAELQRTLEIHHELARAKWSAQTSSPPIPPLRSPSPTPSASSSSSSLSTTSTRTVTPLSCPGPSNPRRASTTSVASSASDVTVRRRPLQKARMPTPPRASPSSSLVRTARASMSSLAGTFEPQSTFALVRQWIRRYLTVNRSVTLSLLFLLLPLLSYLLRPRRGSHVPASTTDQVKQRLLGSGRDSPLRRLWGEIVRAIVDTIRMGGGGLV